jgi:tetratricopeptide (TPR) repeat protein
MLPRFSITVLLVGLLSASPSQPCSAAEVAKANPKVLKAKELLDTYYGARSNLVEAVGLIDESIAENPKDADAYVQSARATIMGGRTIPGEFRAGTIERELLLLDQALKLDPRNAKAYTLRAEALLFKGMLPQALDSLSRARAIAPTDTWVRYGLGKYYESVADYTAANAHYEDTEAVGPGNTAERRKAYLAAVVRLGWIAAATNNAAKLQSWAGIATRERHPKDAWSLMEFADHFSNIGLFDEAIAHARLALKTMDFGAGKLTLAAALYGRAAQLVEAKKSLEANKYLAEARALNYSAPAILGVFTYTNPDVKKLMPTLTSLLPKER